MPIIRSVGIARVSKLVTRFRAASLLHLCSLLATKSTLMYQTNE